jgi:hypothetical protein
MEKPLFFLIRIFFHKSISLSKSRRRMNASDHASTEEFSKTVFCPQGG